jgi:erythromycin esterase-like protein
MTEINMPDLPARLRRVALPLRNAHDLSPLLDAIGDARYILLGEASHGTHEFYTWRCALTKRLVEEKRCAFIAVEGDWPDCYRVNRYVKGYPDAGESATEVLHAFERWPTWMWANREVAELAEWLRAHNEKLPEQERVGFYGLDVYSLWESMEAVIDYLDARDPELAQTARQAYQCFEPYGGNAYAYAKATMMSPESCEEDVVNVLRQLRARMAEYRHDGREAWYNAEQNALIARGAEEYYRAMVRGGPHSWNVRDRHMMETLERLMAYHGEQSRAVVWEHNTHVGDARYTDMADAGMFNLGQLVREEYPGPEQTFLLGFGTHHGTVMAGRGWGAPMERMHVPPAREGSLEDLLHKAVAAPAKTANGDPPNTLMLIFDKYRGGGINGFDTVIDHRAIGVVYNPQAEQWANYVPTVVPRRYDAFIFTDASRALDALHLPADLQEQPPETWPSGM